MKLPTVAPVILLGMGIP
uniref:Uncharacterized protein n=1 Tax=Rhizophora mucronata TaxID=61149 RepID=A0A2P2IW01_RHIMU